MLERASCALESQSSQERYITGTTVSINIEKMDLVAKEIARFQRRIRDLASSEDATDAYQLEVAFFKWYE